MSSMTSVPDAGHAVPQAVARFRSIPAQAGPPLAPADEAALRRRVAELEIELHTDRVTGLATRRAFSARLDTLAAASPNLAVAVFDIDRFRMIHHALGSTGAERALRSVGQVIATALPEAHVVARLYGDEFAVAFPSDDERQAQARTQDVISQFPQTVLAFDPRSVVGGITAGTTHVRTSGNQANELLRDALTAMHVGKRAGGRCCRMFEVQHRVDAIRQLATERDILDGLGRGEFEPWFQPVLDLKSGSLVGIEALARWNHPRRGVLRPGDFIGAAEQGGVIEELGEILVRRTIATALKLQSVMPPDLWVAVNMSPRVVQTPGFSDRLLRILDSGGFPPSRLMLEITEETFIGPTPALLDNVRALRRADVGIALDDFGSGYSSLGALHALPVDVLKIDRTFVTQLLSVSPDESIVATIVAIGRRLKLRVLAEGVERADQAAALDALGVELAQGFFFGEAMPEDRLALWAETRRPGALEP